MGKKKILVIDDEPCILQVLEIHLSAAGYDVICAEDGATGLKYLAEGDVDMVICDFSLPDMNGIGLIRALKAMMAAKAVPPLVVISGYLDDMNEVRVKQSGALEYLRKPFSKEVLLSMVADVLGA